MKFTIPGRPATKKTSQRAFMRNGRQVVLPSKLSEAWERMAAMTISAEHGGEHCTGLVWVRASFFLADLRIGDLHAYEQSLADAIERSGLIDNDKQIASWDGSRRYLDRKNPRVEFEIVDLPEPEFPSEPEVI